MAYMRSSALVYLAIFHNSLGELVLETAVYRNRDAQWSISLWNIKTFQEMFF